MNRILVRVAEAHSDRWVPDHLARWRAWALFADHHGLDPWTPAPEAVVAFIQARTLTGVGYASLNATLGTLQRALADADLVRPARRHLGELHAEGAFGPRMQAPVLTLGQVLGLAEAATASADALAHLLVVGSYRAALRPGEWRWVRYPDHVGIGTQDRTGGVPEVTLVIPRTKQGTAETLDRLLDADERWSNPAVMRDPSQSVGRTPEAKELCQLADDLVALLDAQTPHLIMASSPDDWDRVRMYARTATGLLRYHFWMADTSSGRMARLLGVRDSMMAANLLALAERGPALVNAHNAHLQRDKSTMRMGNLPVEWWSAGAIISAHLGEGYAFLATALGTIRHQGVNTPPPDTLEGLLYALPEDRYVVDAHRLATILGEVTPAPRVSGWYGYSPLDPAHVTNTDAIVFVRNA